LINYEAISIKYYEPVFFAFALVIFHVSLVYAIFYFRVWPIWLYRIFPYYLINGTIFGKKVIESKMWVLIFSTFSILRIKEGIIIYIYIHTYIHVKYPVVPLVGRF
jgi:hypothetical protein